MEKADWYSLYHDGPLRKRRSRKHLKKYIRFNLPHSLENKIILDLCCGAGEFTMISASRNPASTVLGIDVYKDEFPAPVPENIGFIRGDAEKLSLKSGLCDYVFCFHSLHHLGERERWQVVLREIDRVLKPGGELHIIDHHSGYFMRLAMLFFKTPLPKVVPWMSQFKIQLEDENDILNYWLANWRKFIDDVLCMQYSYIRFKKTLFFFYAQFRKTL